MPSFLLAKINKIIDTSKYNDKKKQVNMIFHFSPLIRTEINPLLIFINTKERRPKDNVRPLMFTLTHSLYNKRLTLCKNLHPGEFHHDIVDDSGNSTFADEKEIDIA